MDAAPQQASAGASTGVLRSRAARFHQPALMVFGLAWLLAVALRFRWVFVPFSEGAVDALCISSALVAALVGLGCRVPLQNVVGVVVVTGTVSFAAEWLNIRSAKPFGPIQFLSDIGLGKVGGVPVVVLLFWCLNLIVSRTLAGWILQRYRPRRGFGYGVLALGAGLMVLLDFGWQVYAGRARGHWLWGSTEGLAGVLGVPWSRLLGTAAVGVVLLVVGLPWFIDKHPRPRHLDAGVLVLWVLLFSWFGLEERSSRVWRYFAPAAACALVATREWRRSTDTCNPGNPPYGEPGLGRVEDRSR